MNAKPEQIQTGSNVDSAAKQNLIAPAPGAAELTEVTNEELDRVEGGYGIGTRTGDPGLASIFHKR